MNAVEFQSAAEADLVGAWLQVAEDRGVDAADAHVAKLRDLCELIASQPEMGIARPDVAFDVRSFPVDNYVIYYEICDSNLRILRIRHASQDPLATHV